MSCKYEWSARNDWSLMTKLILKSNIMCILITIWGLWAPVNCKLGDKMKKIRIFSYISSLNINWLVSMSNSRNGRIIPKLILKTNTVGILIIVWGLWVPIECKSEGKITKNRIFSYFSSLNFYELNCKYE